MNRLKQAIESDRFAWENYLNGGTWHGIMLQTEPLFCSYGQIGYSIYVYNGGRHVLTLCIDWEFHTIKEIK